MPLVAIALVSLAAFCAAYGMQTAYRGQSEDADGSIKGLLLWLAEKVDAIRIPIPGRSTRVLGPFADAVKWFANAVDRALGAVVNFFAWPATAFFDNLTSLARQTSGALAAFATHTAHRIAWLERTYVPRYVRVALLGATAPLTAVIAAVHMLRAHALPALWGGLERVGGRVGRLERDAVNTAKRLRRAEAYLTAAGFVVIVATALGRLGLKWLRCRNVSKVGKRACAMDADWLDALLIGSTMVFGAVSFRQFLQECESLADESYDVLRTLTTEL